MNAIFREISVYDDRKRKVGKTKEKPCNGKPIRHLENSVWETQVSC